MYKCLRSVHRGYLGVRVVVEVVQPVDGVPAADGEGGEEGGGEADVHDEVGLGKIVLDLINALSSSILAGFLAR